MLHAGIQKNKAVSLRIEREIFIFQSLAIQTDKAALPTEAGSELVHNAAVHAAVVVLGALAYLGKFKEVNPVAKKVVERKGEAALECGRRRQTCSKRHIPCKNCIKALNLSAALDGLAAHAEDVAAPLLLRLILLVEPEAAGGIVIQGIEIDPGTAVRLDLGNYALVYGSRENVSPVVVCMLTDKVDSSCGSELNATLSVEGNEFFVNF